MRGMGMHANAAAQSLGQRGPERHEEEETAGKQAVDLQCEVIRVERQQKRLFCEREMSERDTDFPSP